MTRVIRPTALKRLKDTYRSSGVLLPHLERHVMKSIGKGGSERDSTVMHPSDMSSPDWCGRHDYYRMVGTPIEKSSKINPSFRMENVFTEGHAIHSKYQQWLWEMGVLFGMWKCRECGHQFGALSPTECQFCRSERLTYREVPLRRKQMMVGGHADGAIHNLYDYTGLIEFKSIGIGTLRFEAPRLYNRYQNGESAEDIWFTINRPFSSHLKQGQLYLWMAWPSYEQIVFLYEFKPTQAVKEFVVSYNQSYISPILETVREVSQGVKAGVPPERPSWAEDAVTKVCISCEYRRTCWELEGAPIGTAQQENENDSTSVVVRGVTSAQRRRILSKT